MIGMRFVVLTLLVPLAGGGARWSRDVRALPIATQIAVYFATGLVTLTLEMMVLAAVGVRWNAWWLLVMPVAGLLSCLVAEKGQPSNPATQQPRNPIVAITLLAIAVFASTVLSAAATSGDFVFFWGTKGQRFGSERLLDVEFLRTSNFNVMHPDYPPLVPLYYAWTMLGETQLDWFAAMASAVLFLALTAAAVREHRYAALLTSMLALLFIRNSVAGNAEPVLFFFETLALAALIARQDFVASIALAGVALTKIEGGVFVIIVAAIWIVRERKWKAALFPLFALAAWLLFTKTNGLVDAYVPSDPLSMRYVFPAIGQLLREMSFGLWYAPWIAIAILLFTGRIRASLPYVLGAVLFLAFLVTVYSRANAHMEWSAHRVLIAPLLLCFFGALAAQRADSELVSDN